MIPSIQSYLCNQENVLALDYALWYLIPYSFAYLSLVLIEVGGVDMPVSNVNRVFYGYFPFIILGLKYLI